MYITKYDGDNLSARSAPNIQVKYEYPYILIWVLPSFLKLGEFCASGIVYSLQDGWKISVAKMDQSHNSRDV